LIAAATQVILPELAEHRSLRKMPADLKSQAAYHNATAFIPSTGLTKNSAFQVAAVAKPALIMQQDCNCNISSPAPFVTNL
jgi:hypothetical protein